MGAPGPGLNPRFARGFPDRLAAVLDEARGAISGVVASGQGPGGLLSPEQLRTLQEIYRLRIELELEVAGVLWRTVEAVCSMTDAIDVLGRRELPHQLEPGEWLPPTPADEVAARREAAGLAGRGPTRPPLEAAQAPDLQPASSAPSFWRRRRGEDLSQRAEAA
jgi:hypothetical protein